MQMIAFHPMYCCALLFMAGLLSQSPAPVNPSVGVWYAGPGAVPPATRLHDAAAVRRDVAAIRSAGFNAIVTWITWTEVEKTQGTLSLAPLEALAAAALEAELGVSLYFYANAAPAWTASLDAGARARARDSVLARLRTVRGIARVSTAEPDATRAAIVVGAKGVRAPRARLAFWEAIARGDLEVSFLGDAGLTPALLALGETAGIVARNPALFAPLRPRKGGVAGVSGSGGAPVEVRLLESAQAIVIVGVNYGATPRPVRITFEPEIPEAIWQNLETGAAVNFVMGPSGPYYDYTFAPNDTLVLMIRKTLR